MGWALLAGTIVQLLVIAAGVVVPAMYVLGVILAALWSPASGSPAARYRPAGAHAASSSRTASRPS